MMLPTLRGIAGHDGPRRVLSRLVTRRRVPPALLLSGPEGVGKRTIAVGLAQALVCGAPENPGGDDCSACRRVARAWAGLETQREEAIRGYAKPDDGPRFNHRLHPDLFLAEPARARSGARERVAGIVIAQVRALVPEMSGPPFEARRRACVIDDAHLMNEQTQNALLKCLEEPASTSHLLLVTAHPEGLLPTIRSRCQALRLGPLPPGALAAHLEAQGLGTEEARLRAQLAEGSVGRALALDLDAYRELRAGLLGRLAGLARGSDAPRLELADWLRELDADEALGALRGLLRDAAVLAGGESAALVNEDVRSELARLAAGPLGARAAELTRAVGEARQDLLGYLDISGRPHGPAHPQMALDGLVDRIADAGRRGGVEP